MGLGPVPWAAIVDYADRAGLTGESAEVFAYMIRKLDGAYIKMMDAEKQRSSAGNKPEG